MRLAVALRLAACGLAAALLAAGCGGHSPERPSALRRPVADFDADFRSFLARTHRGGGEIDYAAAARDSSDLDRYIARLRAVSPDSDPSAFPTADRRLAYWINAYNAWAIRFVLDHYPIESVNDVRPPLLLRFLPQGAGFFYFQQAELGGRTIGLYDLENRLVRRRFDDPRIHFALNCASRGCPELPARPFAAGDLDAELARETARFLADPDKLRIDADARVVWVSAILDWYEGDFTDWVERERPGLPATLRSWIAAHLPEPRASWLAACDECRIEFIDYDWSLNDAR